MSTDLYRMTFTALPAPLKKQAEDHQRIAWKLELLVDGPFPQADERERLLGMMVAEDAIVEPPWNETSDLYYGAKVGDKAAFAAWTKALKKNFFRTVICKEIVGTKVRGWKGTYPAYKAGAIGTYSIVGRPGVPLMSWLKNGETTAYPLHV